ncbi:MAG: serine hydrolase domain-containing protein [Bacteroidota bacterium]
MINRSFKNVVPFFMLIIFLTSCGEAPPAPISKVPKTPLLPPEEQALIDEYDYIIREQFRIGNAPTGMAVAIVKDGKILLEKGYGLKLAGSRDSVDRNTVFRIASLSKGFASVLAAMMVAEKKLTWNAKVKDYIPNFRLSNDTATQMLNLRHVLSHATGLPRHTYGNLIEAGQSMEQMIPQLASVPLIAKPGRVMAYQNLAYSLCQPMLESATGMTYDSLLQQYIYNPLGMQGASTNFDSLLNHTNLAQPHRSPNGPPRRQKADYFSVLPAAGVNASIADMALWLQLLLGHRPDIISGKNLEPIYKKNNTLPKNNPWSRSWDGVNSVGYAMGWRTIDYKGQPLIYHGGYLNGYRTEMAFDLEADVGIVLLSNSFSGFIMQSIPTFFEVYNDIYSPQDSVLIPSIDPIRPR